MYDADYLAKLIKETERRLEILERKPSGTGSSNPLAAYPIGSIYMSVVNTNPSEIFGGTWVAWGSGRVPVGVDTGQTEFDTVEETGGAKTHTLSTSEMPAHTHGSRSLTGSATWIQAQENSNFSGIMSGGGINYYFAQPAQQANSAYRMRTISINATHEHDTVGLGSAHNNLPPYITCFMWKRTA